MSILLVVHIAAGAVGIVSGYAALFAGKGTRLHRKAGMLFVCSMVTMALGAAALGNVVGGLFTAYLVLTALTTMRRRPTAGARRIDIGLMLVALATGGVSVAFGLVKLASPVAPTDGVPPFVPFLFGVIALLAGLSDLRVIRSGGVHGTARLARHLWRMCYAMFIATGSFFLGQADELPQALRIFPLLAIAAFLPLLLMPYWLWRVRSRRTQRGTVPVTAPLPG